MVYLQSGPENKISSIFQVVNPLTGKIFTVEEINNAIGEKVQELQKMVDGFKEESNNKLEKDDYPRLPAWNDTKMEKAEFAELVRQHVRALHPSKKLLVLNLVQRKTPFMLMNPAQRFTGADYGYADLLRFLCAPVKSGEVAHFIKNGDNPFYQPIRYSMPDKEGNQQLAMLMLNTRQFYIHKLVELMELNKQFQGGRHSLETQMNLIDKMVHILKEVYLFRMNPLALSQIDNNQKRPMSTYRKDHYLDLLMMLTTKKRAQPATFGTKPPTHNTGVEFVNHELNVARSAHYL